MRLDNRQLKDLRDVINDQMFEYLKEDNFDARSALSKVLEKNHRTGAGRFPEKEMILYKLSRSREAGFKQSSVVIGYYTSKLLARKQAEAIEPRKDIRDYEFGYTRIKLTSTESQIKAIAEKHNTKGTRCTSLTGTKRKSSKRTLKSRD